MSNKVCIFGASGMLGSVVLDVFARADVHEIVATVKDSQLAHELKGRYPSVNLQVFDAGSDNCDRIAALMDGCEWSVNAIGIIKPYIHDNVASETERAVLVNALFPHRLATAAEKTQTTVLQIATDCVYSGAKGDYVETDPHDALDVYGKSKSLGEITSERMRHLRCSIIGPEPRAHVSLLDWFLGQPQHASVNGFTNHSWNGITTLHYGKLALGIVKQGTKLPQSQHIVPTEKIFKYDLLRAFARSFKRDDMTINPMAASTIIDRTLATANDDVNSEVWRAAGYAKPPTIVQMVEELAEYGAAR